MYKKVQIYIRGVLAMLEHIIDIPEASTLWGIPPDVIEEMCLQQRIVSKRIGEIWIVFKDQEPSRLQTQEAAIKLSEEIEWSLLTPAERRAILDKNTRVFYQRAHWVKAMKERGIGENLIRDFFDNLTDEEFEEIKEAANELDSL